VWCPPDGLSRVIGETPLVAVDMSGDGLMGDKFVGDVTEREDRLRESKEHGSGDLTTKQRLWNEEETLKG
jgi:hypothetical protein